MDQQRASQGPDGSYDLKDSHIFAYEALSKELFVGNVYLRVYNDQPEFEISEPEGFCVALIDYIASLVHYQSSVDSDIQEKLNISNTSSEPEHRSDASGASVDEQQVPDDSLATSDSKVKDKEENVLVKNLQAALTALKVIYFFVSIMS